MAGEADWFKFQVNGNGAHNIYTVKDTDTKIELYKKTWYGSYVLIDSNDDISITDWNCRLEVGLETGVDYYIKITAYGKDTGEYALRLEENRDNMSCPTGGSWMWDVASFILSNLSTFVFPNLTEMELESIAEAGGMDSEGNFKYGIKIQSVTTYSSLMVPVMLNTYETWRNGYMFGADRYRGTFDITDKTPMWR